MAELTLEQRIERMEGAHECQNLIGRLELLHAANEYRKCMDLHALDTPGVTIEMDWGVYEGRAGVERFYLNYHGPHEASNDSPRNGELHLHTISTMVLEVADDLQTATGAYVSPGVETGAIAPTGQPGQTAAYWLWNKCSFDCIKESGRWKIWHFRVFNSFICPYYTSWVDAGRMPARPPMPPEKAPDRYLPSPSAWSYSVDKPALNIPAPPEPYATYSEIKQGSWRDAL